MSTMIHVTVASRPYLMTFRATGTTYPLTADEVRNLLEEYPVIHCTAHRLVLPGHNTPDPRQRIDIRPATRGGGPSFTP
jgi:hypothetical protein